MKRPKLVFFAFACLLISQPLISGQKPALSRLRLLTINAWSGLDYQGFFKFGEYESAERREARFAALVQQVKALDPDVVFVQEANFAGRYAHHLAAALGLTEIHQVLNGGIKLGPIGLPVNFKEGMAILARPELRLRRHDVWKLSGPFGLYGDAVSFHFGEAVFSLVGKVLINETPLYLVNVHLAAGPPDEEDLFRRFRERPEGRVMSAQQFEQAIIATKERNQQRQKEVQRLLKDLKSLPDGAPVIVAGDFNAEMRAPEMQTFTASAGVLDTLTTARERTTAGSLETVINVGRRFK